MKWTVIGCYYEDGAALIAGVLAGWHQCADQDEYSDGWERAAWHIEADTPCEAEQFVHDLRTYGATPVYRRAWRLETGDVLAYPDGTRVEVDGVNLTHDTVVFGLSGQDEPASCDHSTLLRTVPHTETMPPLGR